MLLDPVWPIQSSCRLDACTRYCFRRYQFFTDYCELLSLYALTLESILPLEAPLDTSIGTSIGLVINSILVSILTVASRLMASTLRFFFLHRLLSFLFQFVSTLLVNALLSLMLSASLLLSMLRCQSIPHLTLDSVSSCWWGFAMMLFFYRQHTAIFSSSNATLLLTTSRRPSSRACHCSCFDPFNGLFLSPSTLLSCLLVLCWHTRRLLVSCRAWC